MKETDKQLAYIRFIEEETNILYTGKTKQDASKYISENKNNIPPCGVENMWSIINCY